MPHSSSCIYRYTSHTRILAVWKGESHACAACVVYKANRCTFFTGHHWCTRQHTVLKSFVRMNFLRKRATFVSEHALSFHFRQTVAVAHSPPVVLPHSRALIFVRLRCTRCALLRYEAVSPAFSVLDVTRAPGS